MLDLRDAAVPYRQALRGVRVLVGHVRALELSARTVTVDCPDEGILTVTAERIPLAPGAVTRQFDIPGLADHAHGLKTLREAVYLRDHMLAQLDLADTLPAEPEHDADRRRRLTAVVVGAGYTGTELVAQLQFWLSRVTGRWSRVDSSLVRWVLIDVAPQVLPELGPRLGPLRPGPVARPRRRGSG